MGDSIKMKLCLLKLYDLTLKIFNICEKVEWKGNVFIIKKDKKNKDSYTLLQGYTSMSDGFKMSKKKEKEVIINFYEKVKQDAKELNLYLIKNELELYTITHEKIYKALEKEINLFKLTDEEVTVSDLGWNHLVFSVQGRFKQKPPFFKYKVKPKALDVDGWMRT